MLVDKSGKKRLDNVAKSSEGVLGLLKQIDRAAASIDKCRKC